MQTWMRSRHPVTLALMWLSRRRWWRRPAMNAAPTRSPWDIDLYHAVAHG